MNSDVGKFIEARDFLWNAKNYEDAYENFQWPDVSKFNWGIDYFDRIAKDNDNLCLICVDEDGNDKKVTYEQMRKRSNQVANFLRDLGLQKGDNVFVIMDTAVETFEVMLGIIKAGGVFIPGAITLPPKDIADRIERGNIKFMFVHNAYVGNVAKTRMEALRKLKALINVGDKLENPHMEEDIPDWTCFSSAYKHRDYYSSPFITYTNDPMFKFFTSGTTAQPKLVIHNHIYPVGHLTTMYWINIRKGDVHYNISSPGWAKFAWSSFIAPWNAEATVLTIRYKQFNPEFVLKMIEKYKVNTLCAPFSVLKLFAIQDLSKYKFSLREFISAGEPLLPDVVRKLEEELNVEIREGYGQTETTALIGDFKGVPKKAGSFGKVAPGYKVGILDEHLDDAGAKNDGQICIKTYPVKPAGLLSSYDDDYVNRQIFKGTWYLTGDSGYYDEDGYFYFVGRTDDVFKSLDYRISPFEVESEISEHPSVMEVAVVPTVDDRDRIVPKAFIVLKPDYVPERETALDIFRFIRDNIAPYKRPRSIEFMREFPKTISAKVMRRSLRAYDEELRSESKKGEFEFKELDFEKELNLRARR
jgi:acetyl-CoA synthetase